MSCDCDMSDCLKNIIEEDYFNVHTYTKIR